MTVGIRSARNSTLDLVEASGRKNLDLPRVGLPRFLVQLVLAGVEARLVLARIQGPAPGMIHLSRFLVELVLAGMSHPRLVGQKS